MDPKWTEEQQKAISERGRNILVSAGAGSGKTAVMVERALRLIAIDRVPVDAMLIVTFTKAAAGEMQGRLRKALKDRLAGPDVSVTEQGWIREQLDRLPGAQISTFHSFAGRVLRDFFYFTDIEPGFRVLDEAEAEVMKEQALEDLFDAEYEEENEDFMAFMDAYSGEKNDADARDLITELYRKLEAVPDRFAVLDSKVEEIKADVDEFRSGESYGRMKALLKGRLEEGSRAAENAAKLLDDAGLPRLAGLIRIDREYFEDALSLLEKGDVDRAAEIMRTVKFERVAAKGEEREIYDEETKNRMTALRDIYKARAKDISDICYDSLENMVKSRQMTYPYAVTLSRLIKRYDGIYAESKRDINAIDYSDMEHYALSILDHEEARDFYRKTFRYIFIDEYQDTNIMQETIIGRITKGDDLFMVGDIKQSIYHFRLADPDIFKEKYRRYSENGDDSIKIDLSRNFRSKAPVIDEINRMFRPMMEGYDKAAELVHGASDGEYGLGSPETHIVDISGIDESEDEELADLHKEELEAMEAARIIKDVVGRKITDVKTGKVREIDYRDIVILMRSIKRSVDGYRSVFREKRIPLYIDDRAGYFDTIEINVFVSLISVIDNKRQDVPFIAVLRSEIFGFSVKELAMIRKLRRDGSFVEAAMSAAEDPDAPEELRKKLVHVFECIKRWQAYAVTLPLPDLIWRLMNETGYYIVAGTFPGGAERQANLRLLADRAKEYAERSFGSLYGFIKYIETVKKNQVDMPQATLLSENENVVRIMTIHHSKGLEFPVVILSGMDNRHRGSGQSGALFDREEGFGLRTRDPKRHLYEDGIISRMIKAKDRKYEAEELERVFYVAVTRAMEKFYLVGAADYDKVMDGIATGAVSDTTLLRMSRYLPNVVRVPAQELKDDISALPKKDQAYVSYSSYDPEEVARRLDYTYPYSEAGELAAKTTVTKLNELKRSYKGSWQFTEYDGVDQPESLDSDEENIEQIREFEEPLFMRGREGVTAGRRGTAYHSVMEALDFSRAGREGIKYVTECMASLVRDGLFTEEEMRKVSPGKILGFFESGLGKRAVSASEHGVLYKEQTFESKMRVSGEDVLIQGVADCFFEEEDGIVLLDYKTNYIDRDKDLDEEIRRVTELYRAQLEAYQDALEKATGKRVKEKYLYLFSLDREVEVR